MQTRTLRPTVTHQVRSFLASQGAGLRPAAGLDETYAELYALMRRGRDDQELWRRLEGLLRDIVSTALDPSNPARLPAPEAEVLASWDIRELVADLRRAVSAPARDHAAIGTFLSGLSASVMGGFLVLGLALSGCDSSECDDGACDDAAADGDADSDADTDGDVDGDTDGDADSDADTDADPDVDADPEPDGDVDLGACGSDALRAVVESADMNDVLEGQDEDIMRQMYCRCFDGMNQSWVNGLETLFATATPEQIADALSNVLECCVSPETRPPEFDEDFYCIAPAYKGVSFGRW